MFATAAELGAMLLPVAAAWLWIGRLCSIPHAHRLAAALGLGFGLASVLFCVWRAIGHDPRAFVLADAAIWVLACAAAMRGARFQPHGEQAAAGRAVVAASAIVLLAFSAPLATAQMSAAPNGAWDAWAIWNLRARFLATSGGEWVNAFSQPLLWSHPDYPLLLPASVARGWLLAGGPEMWVPSFISLLFPLAAALTVAASLFERRGAYSSVTGLALIAVPSYIEQGAGQMADLAVGFYGVLAFSLLARPREAGPAQALAGAALGLAAWTKNEGLAVAAIAVLTTVAAEWRAFGWQSALRSGVDLLRGLAPVLMVVAGFKAFLAPENDLVAGLFAPGAITYWSDRWRTQFVASYMLTNALTWGGWPVGSPVWPLILMAAWPAPGRGRLEPAVTAAGWCLALLLLVFTAVYVMTPHSVAWHLQTSWHRLIAQLWPVAVWWACMRWSSGREK